MCENLFLGMTIYHKTNKTKALITGIDQNNIIVELSKEIACKKVLSLPITHIGEWLFFDENDVELSADILAHKPEYLKYNNQKILDAYNKNIEQKKKMEIEEKRKLIEIKKQKEIESQKQRIIEEELKYEAQLKTELINFLKENYHFDGFHHYTDFVNFINIMNTGKLFSRNEAQKYGFYDAADQSVIAGTKKTVKDYVRFYYKENTPTTYKNEGIKTDNSIPHMPIPVLLLFHENIIYQNDIYFTSGCAGSKFSNFTKNAQMAKNFNWEAVFSRGWIPIDIKMDMINKRNAEFLFNQEIEIKHIKKIIFRSPADLKHAVLVLGKNDLFDVNPLKFHKHRNYLYDYNFDYQQDCYNITLIYHSDQGKYSHELRITYNDGFSEKIDISIPNKRINKKSTQKNNVSKFDFIPLNNRLVNRIQYLMNGHVCALWERTRTQV